MALQTGYEDGQARVNRVTSTVGASPATNFWSYLNTIIGTYPNTLLGYLYRAAIVLEGGSANVPLDGVYAQINNLDGTPATQIDGNNTYKLTFTPPVTNPTTLPVIGSLPPTVNDSQGNPRGFWSIHVYQTDTTQSAAPFITQASVLNTAYSTANIPVTAVDPSTDTITVQGSDWGPLIASTPILFGSTASTVRSHTRRSVLRRDDADTADRPERPMPRHTPSRCRPSGSSNCPQPTSRSKATRRYGHPRARSSS